MHKRTNRLVLLSLSTFDHEEGRRSEVSLGAARSETDHPWERATVSTVLQADTMTKLFVLYIKGRVFEWTFALGMLFTGLELLVWDQVLTFGAFRWLSYFMSQKWIGTIMLFTGWIRVSSLMFNGQLMFGVKIGPVIRAACAVVSGALWAQFMLALLQLSFDQGYPSVGVPIWTMLVIAELVTAYSVGAEWKK